MSEETEDYPKPRKKFSYIGAPACFALDMAVHHVYKAFGGSCYVVGSALERPDWRDIDVRMIMDDEEFEKEFPGVGGHWEFDSKWLLLTTAISNWLSKESGLPVDFQFQPMTRANNNHKGPRHPIGFRLAKQNEE